MCSECSLIFRRRISGTSQLVTISHSSSIPFSSFSVPSRRSKSRAVFTRTWTEKKLLFFYLVCVIMYIYITIMQTFDTDIKYENKGILKFYSIICAFQSQIIRISIFFSFMNSHLKAIKKSITTEKGKPKVVLCTKLNTKLSSIF